MKKQVTMQDISKIVEQFSASGLRLRRHGVESPREPLDPHPTHEFNEESPKRVAEVMHWLETYAEPSKTATYSSYSLKHAVEEVSQYTANGEAIVAAVLAGYRWRRNQDGLNLNIFMKGKWKLNIHEIRLHNKKRRPEPYRDTPLNFPNAKVPVYSPLHPRA